MSGSGWSIRLFEANEYDDEFTIDFMDNFTKGKSRQLDSLRTYSGMYGIDNYLVWNLHKDLPNYDFSTVALDLNLFMYKSTEIPYFQEFYRVQDIRYNPNKSQYTLYAVSETTVRLHTKLVNYNITSLSYKENRTAKELLKETIEAKNIFYLRFHDDALSTKDNIHYQYRYFDIDPEWTVLDLIEYIANDNQYEWCVTTFVDKGTNKPYFFLHIGHELKPDRRMNATKKFNIENDNISDSVYTTKITTSGSPMQPLAHWEESLRCLWSKHSAGKGGGISKGCFAPIGMGHFDKSLYLRTLEGNIERNVGYSMLTKSKRRFSSISIGNILKDEGDPQFIDVVSVQKNPKTYSIREPHNILINRGEDIAVQHQLEKATRSTPYLDHEAGLLFPSPTLLDEEDEVPPPNSLIFNVDGKRESAVVGGYVYGDGRQDEDGNKTLKIPFKAKKEDFRLRFPDGAEIYYDSDEKMWIMLSPKGIVFKNSIVNYDELPKDVYKPDGSSVMYLVNDDFVVKGDIAQMVLLAGGCFQVAPQGDAQGEGLGMFSILCSNDNGQIALYADNFIKIRTSEPGGDIEITTYDSQGQIATGTININTKGTVNIGADASVIRLAGGGKKISHGDHKHMTGNMGIPVPEHITAEGSDITEVD